MDDEYADMLSRTMSELTENFFCPTGIDAILSPRSR